MLLHRLLLFIVVMLRFAFMIVQIILLEKRKAIRGLSFLLFQYLSLSCLKYLCFYLPARQVVGSKLYFQSHLCSFSSLFVCFSNSYCLMFIHISSIISIAIEA